MIYRRCDPSANFFHQISKQKSCDASVVTVSTGGLWIDSQGILSVSSIVAVVCYLGCVITVEV